jgi:hypothetical protein
VVGAVVDGVLYEPGLSKDVGLKRAKAILTIGGIFKAVEADESDEERRELERCVASSQLRGVSAMELQLRDDADCLGW